MRGWTEKDCIEGAKDTVAWDIAYYCLADNADVTETIRWISSERTFRGGQYSATYRYSGVKATPQERSTMSRMVRNRMNRHNDYDEYLKERG